MGRLYWKFFLVIFLAQLVSANVVGAFFWYHERNRAAEIMAHQSEPGAEGDGFRPPQFDAAPGGGARPMPLPPRPPAIPVFPVLVGFVASLIFAVFLARHLSRPIVGLRQAFDEVAHGNFDVSLAAQMEGRNDELADLGRAFDRTAAKLKQLIDSQRRLLHDVSHEVRSPLARMQLAIDVARQQPEKVVASMERIERESARIDRLVGELLTLSRLEARSCGAMDEEVSVSEMLAEIVEDARFEAQARHCKVELVETEICGSVKVRGRPELLQRAIENVIRNALRYTFDGTVVQVTESVVEGELRIWVDDDGPGLPDNALDAMFEPFVRFRDERSSDGYGLGLAITRQTVEAHAGAVTASNRKNGGLRVEIRLPVLSG